MRLKTAFVAMMAGGFLLTAVPSREARAGLVLETHNGVNLILDTVTDTTWSQNANVSGQTFTYQGATAWAAGLTLADLSWALPTAAEFTSLFTQLDPYGAPGTQSNKYGAQVFFAPGGGNNFAANVQPEYWTSTSNADFNFYYGYQGYQPNTNLYAAWAVVDSPEPSQVILALSGLAALGTVRLRRAVRSKS